MEGEPATYHFVARKPIKTRWAGGDGSVLACAVQGNVAQGETHDVALWGWTVGDDPVELCRGVAEDGEHFAELTHDLEWLNPTTLLAARDDGSLSMLKYSLDMERNLNEVRTWRGVHRSACTSVAVGRDGVHVATGGDDGALVLVDTTRTGVVATTAARSSPASDVAFLSSDVVAAVGSSSHIRRWDTRTSTPLAPLKDHSSSPLHCLAQHTEQPHYVAVGSADGVMAVWDLRQEKWPCTRVRAHAANVWEVQFQSERVVTCGEDGNVLKWDFNPRKESSSALFQRADEEGLAISQLVSNTLAVTSFDVDPYSGALVCSADNFAMILKQL